MPRTDYQTLVNRGRKAGLGTRELYSALSARRPEDSDQTTGRTDSNGFVSVYGRNGQRVYRPGQWYPRS